MKKANYVAAIISTIGFVLILVAMIMLESGTDLKTGKNLLDTTIDTKVMATSTRLGVGNNNVKNKNIDNLSIVVTEH